MNEQKQEHIAVTKVETSVALVKIDTALKSLRSSEFDTPAAVGELIDNSIQACAKAVSIRLSEAQRAAGKGRRSLPSSWTASPLPMTAQA